MSQAPQYNTEAERAVIALLISKPESTISPVLTAQCEEEWFYTPTCRVIYRVILDLHSKGTFIELVTVSNHHEITTDLEIELHEIYSEYADFTNLNEYLRILRIHYAEREFVTITQSHIDMIGDGTSLNDVINSYGVSCNEIEKMSIQKKPPSREDVITAIRREYEKAESSGCTNIPSRFLAVQRKLGGYKKKKNIIIAARPGMGKSTYVRNEILTGALNGRPGGLISMEMSRSEVYIAMACDIAEVDSSKYNNGSFTNDEKIKFDKALDIVMKLPIHIAEGYKDADHISNWIRKVAPKEGISLVGIDYVQLILRGRRKEFTHELLSIQSKMVLEAADEADVANLLVSMIGRSGEAPPNAPAKDRARYVPRLRDLKSSGSLEEDAYSVIILHEDPYVAGDIVDDSRVSYIADIAKNRGGKTCAVPMTFNKPFQRFQGRQETPSNLFKEDPYA